MKKIIYKIFKPKIYNRFIVIKSKQISRLERLNKVINDLRTFNDIPLSVHFPCICADLKIQENEAAKSFVFELAIGSFNIEEQAKKLPLI